MDIDHAILTFYGGDDMVLKLLNLQHGPFMSAESHSQAGSQASSLSDSSSQDQWHSMLRLSSSFHQCCCSGIILNTFQKPSVTRK